jgi:flagellar assembly protein FliH
MLSKVLRGDEATVAQPLAWKRAAGTSGPLIPTAPVNSVPPAGAARTSVALAPGVKPPGSVYRQIVTTNDQVEVLQERVAELERDMDRRVREAREIAYREGENNGRTQAAAQVQPMLEKLARSIGEIAELRPQLRHQAEADLLKLAMAIARKIVHREVTADPEALAGLLRVAMEKIRLREILRVRTHPQHQAIIQQLVARFSGGAHVEVQGDGRLPLGGVIIETERGEFDVSVDTQFREIERGLADRLAAANLG